MDEFKWVKDLIKETLTDAEVDIHDLTGTKDHLEIKVKSKYFVNKSLIEQHRMLMTILSDQIKSNRIHAVKLVTHAQS
jgi:stress-induced morphogen